MDLCTTSIFHIPQPLPCKEGPRTSEDRRWFTLSGAVWIVWGLPNSTTRLFHQFRRLKTCEKVVNAWLFFVCPDVLQALLKDRVAVTL